MSKFTVTYKSSFLRLWMQLIDSKVQVKLRKSVWKNACDFKLACMAEACFLPGDVVLVGSL